MLDFIGSHPKRSGKYILMHDTYYTVATIVIETLFPVPLPDVAQYQLIPFPVPTG